MSRPLVWDELQFGPFVSSAPPVNAVVSVVPPAVSASVATGCVVPVLSQSMLPAVFVQRLPSISNPPTSCGAFVGSVHGSAAAVASACALRAGAVTAERGAWPAAAGLFADGVAVPDDAADDDGAADGDVGGEVPAVLLGDGVPLEDDVLLGDDVPLGVGPVDGTVGVADEIGLEFGVGVADRVGLGDGDGVGDALGDADSAGAAATLSAVAHGLPAAQRLPCGAAAVVSFVPPAAPAATVAVNVVVADVGAP